MSKAHYIPAPCCVICDKTLPAVGGRRAIHTPIRSVHLSEKFRGGGDPDYPEQSRVLNEDGSLFVTVKGEKSLWTAERIEKAAALFKQGLRPWFCQVCAGRLCNTCGSPAQYLHGCSTLADNGCTGYSAILPVPPGCINALCSKHRKAEGCE